MIRYTYLLSIPPNGNAIEHETHDPATVRAAMKAVRADRFRLKRLIVEPPYVTKRYEREFK